jgi:cytochrome b involved in lipid metabolism
LLEDRPNFVIYLLESSSSSGFDNSAELNVIQEADLENHNKEGGLWVVIHGKVFDLQEFKDQVC